MTADEVGLGGEEKLTRGFHTRTLPWLSPWGSFYKATDAGAPPSEIWILLVWGGALAPVGIKSSSGNSNVQPDLLITVLRNGLSTGIISENPTGKTEGILIDYVID